MADQCVMHNEVGAELHGYSRAEGTSAPAMFSLLRRAVARNDFPPRSKNPHSTIKTKEKTMKNLIRIAIDGPSGAGKSSLAKGIAKKYSIPYVDTGALYRTVGYAARREGIEPDDNEKVTEMLSRIEVKASFSGEKQVNMLDGVDLGEAIREHAISRYASLVSANPAVRAYLLDMQKDIARKNSVVMDGRDIGTVIIPDAEVKIFLTASAEDRARRRYDELILRGESPVYERILADVIERDHQDSSRDIAPMRAADDAVLLDNSGFTPEMSLAAAMAIIDKRLAK